VAQAVKCLPGKCKALRSNPSTQNKKINKIKNKGNKRAEGSGGSALAYQAKGSGIYFPILQKK
jgi:hypothetical protein